MEHKPIYPEIRPENVVIPEGKSLASWLDSRIARYETRSLDWDALKFQADYDPKYRRAQMRYIGTGGTGIEGDENAVPAEHFTFSTMVLPAGCEGPLHLHTDAEEVFFVLRGNKLRFIIEHQGELYSLIVDSVGEVLSLDSSTYERELPTLDPRWRDFAAGIYRLNGALLIVLEVAHLLTFNKAEAA